MVKAKLLQAIGVVFLLKCQICQNWDFLSGVRNHSAWEDILPCVLLPGYDQTKYPKEQRVAIFSNVSHYTDGSKN